MVTTLFLFYSSQKVYKSESQGSQHN